MRLWTVLFFSVLTWSCKSTTRPVQSDAELSGMQVDSSSLEILPDNGTTPAEIKAFTKAHKGALDKIFDLYVPLIKSHGKDLMVLLVSNPSFNPAYRGVKTAVQEKRAIVLLEKEWSAKLSTDTIALALCHEMGHVVGGYPLHSLSNDKMFVSSEGQSDYYASQVCIRKIWGNSAKLNAESRARAEKKAEFKPAIAICDKAWKDKDDSNLCIRTLLASMTMLDSVNDGEGSGVSFVKPDTTKAPESIVNRYASMQCRLDTLVAGAVCPQNFDIKKIPMKADAAKQSSCWASAKGARPACWFKG